jgi:hypothetical protein
MYRIENERFSFTPAIARDMFLSPFTISLYQMRLVCHMQNDFKLQFRILESHLQSI